MSSQAHYYDSPAVVGQYAGRSDLLPAEAAILARLGPTLATAAVLDIGVGGGRTALHLAPPAARYVGVDFAGGMVEECQRRFRDVPGFEHAEFERVDARDLRRYPDGAFDVVWFSYNGLDTVGGHPDRLRALAEMARVCAPGGVVVFSSHNLNGALRLERPGLGPRLPIALARALSARRGTARMNPQLRRGVDSGEAMVREVRPSGHVVEHFFVRPDVQVAQLGDLGLREAQAVTATGRAITDATELCTHVEAHTHYWARR